MLAGWIAGIEQLSTPIAGLTLLEVGLVAAIAIFTARLLDRSDSARARSDAEQRRLAALVESSTDAIISATADGVMASWNRGAERLFGYSAEEALGQPIGILAPEDRAGEPDSLLRRVRSGELLERLETQRRHKDGRRIDVALSVSPIMNAQQELVGASVIASDITARKRAEERERADVEARILWSEVQLAESQQVARIGTWEWAVKSDEVVWSAETARMHGRGRDGTTVSFQAWLETIHPDDREHAIAAVEQALMTGAPYSAPYKTLLPDGEVRTIQSSGQVIAGADGTPERLVGTARDLTDDLLAAKEKERLEARVRQSERLESVGQLAGGIAHDFNNLLGVILNYAEFVGDELEDDHPARQDVEEIRRAGERAAALTRQLLMFSRRERVKREVLDVNGVIGDLERLLTRTLGDHIELVTTLDADAWRVEADGGQIEQLLVNLAVNARDAMTEGGRVTVATSNVEVDEEFASAREDLQVGRYTRITVSDTGTGMPPEVAERIFEPFFTTKAKGQGTGLGLATVYGIVTQTGGHIEVYTEQGVGTIFKVFLPASNLDAPVAPVDESRPPPASGETILLVEDEPVVRELTRRILAQHGYNVLAAEDGYAGVESWREHAGEIDLLLTDVVMPEMSGPEVAERVRELQPEVGVLYMSGYTDDFVVRRGVVDEDVQLIEKPFTANDLLDAVRGVLESRPAGPQALSGRADVA